MGLSIVTIAFANVPRYPDPPEKPTVHDVTKDGCTVKYKPPTYDGGSSITGYLIELRYVNDTKWIEVNGKTPWDGLTFEVYSVRVEATAELRVRAVNKIGISAASDPSDPVTFR